MTIHKDHMNGCIKYKIAISDEFEFEAKDLINSQLPVPCSLSILNPFSPSLLSCHARVIFEIVFFTMVKFVGAVNDAFVFTDTFWDS